MSSTEPEPSIVYPESDGKPMADNMLQFSYIVYIKEGLSSIFHQSDDVLVAGDLLWYPVEKQPAICAAPDAMVVFGRPRRMDLGSYKQFEEDDIAPQVVFEVISPNNTAREMEQKLDFYDEHGVEEYYVYDPQKGTLEGYQRDGEHLRAILEMNGWVSPRLGVRFELRADELILYESSGEMFRSLPEHNELRKLAEQRAEEERQRAEEERQRADKAEQELTRLRERLHALGVEIEDAE